MPSRCCTLSKMPASLPSKHGPTQPHLLPTPWKAATILQWSPGPLKEDILFVTLGLATPPLHLHPAWAFRKDPHPLY